MTDIPVGPDVENPPVFCLEIMFAYVVASENGSDLTPAASATLIKLSVLRPCAARRC